MASIRRDFLPYEFKAAIGEQWISGNNCGSSTADVGKDPMAVKIGRNHSFHSRSRRLARSLFDPITSVRSKVLNPLELTLPLRVFARVYYRSLRRRFGVRHLH